MERHCGTYYCESSRCEKVLLTETASEGLILENICKKEELFLVHGHQGDLLNDTLWPVARFLVRYIWRHLELVGFLDPTGAGRPRKAKERVEKKPIVLCAGALPNSDLPATRTDPCFHNRKREIILTREAVCIPGVSLALK